MFFQKEELDKLIEMTDMYNLVSRYVKLEKRGDDYKGLCPFHNESNPSFSVSTRKKIAKCFSCGGGGNPISFLMQIENISYADAVFKLAEINNFELSTKPDKDYYLKKNLYDMYNLATKFYSVNLINSKLSTDALSYLNRRGIDLDLIKHFQLGFASKDNLLYKLFLKQNYDTYEMLNSGLINSYNNEYVDFFRSRLIFPILNEFGDVVALSGRVLDNTKPKYINSKESLVFQKNKVIYNFYHAKEYIKEQNRVFIFEGYMDVISAYKVGLAESIAGMGLFLSKSSLDLIKPLTNNLILCYDSDEAGILASYNFFILARESGFNLKILPIRGYKDFDELVNSQDVDVKEYVLNNLLDPITYFFEYDCKKQDLNDSNAVLNLKKRFSSIIPFLSALEKDLYLKEFYSLTKIKLNPNVKKVNVISVEDNNLIPNLKKSTYDQVLKRLFLYAINSKQKALVIDENFNLHHLYKSLPKFYQDIWDLLIYNFYSSYEFYDNDTFIALVLDNNLSDSFEELNLLENDNHNFSDEDLKDCINFLKLQANRKDIYNVRSIEDLNLFFKVKKNREDS